MKPIYERRDERFGLVLNSQEKEMLLAIAEREHISAAAVLRRLLWYAADELEATGSVKAFKPWQ